MGNDLPLYMVVDFPGLRLNGAKPWDANNPTVSHIHTIKLKLTTNSHTITLSYTKHVPIPMQELHCKNGCCTATFCPLVLSWGITVHKFQGFEAGFGIDDMVKYIIADMNALKWEQDHPGTAYTVTSRSKTIGIVTEDNPYPMESNIFFDGEIGINRFINVRLKQNGEDCLLIEKRDRWAEYLQQKTDATKTKYTDTVLSSLNNTNKSHLSNPVTTNESELRCRIMNIISDPNPTWKVLRKEYIVQ